MISITVPVFNEKENLQPLLTQIRDVMAKQAISWEVIFVNDGSTDGSREELDRIVSSNSDVRVIHFRKNFGQTAAMMAGFDHARGEIVIPMDADLQNDPKDIPRLVAKLNEGYDVVSGWRQNRQDDALRRNFLSHVANWLISKVTNVPLHDYGCSLKAYRKNVIKDIKLYGEMHRFIPIYASWNGARITELPVDHHPRVFGESKYGMQRIFKVILDLLVVIFLSRFSQKPMYLFGIVSFASFFISLVAAAWAVLRKLFDNTSFIQTPLPLLSIFSFLNGTMCLLLGLIAEMVLRTYHESQNKTTYTVIDPVGAERR